MPSSHQLGEVVIDVEVHRQVVEEVEQRWRCRRDDDDRPSLLPGFLGGKQAIYAVYHLAGLGYDDEMRMPIRMTLSARLSSTLS